MIKRYLMKMPLFLVIKKGFFYFEIDKKYLTFVLVI